MKQKIGFTLLGILVIILFCVWNPLTCFPDWKPPEELPASCQRRIRKELTSIQDAGCTPADRDAMEERLIALGFPTVDSDPVYPSFLANSGALYDFWHSVSAEQDAELSVLRVTEDGELHHLFFLFRKENPCFFLTEIQLDADGKLADLSTSVLPIYDMELADWDIFYYRLSPSDPHYIDNNQFRLTPPDHDLYDWNRTYILPVGYQMVNLFLVDWSEENWDALSLNDLLEALYTMKMGCLLDWSAWLRPGVSSYAYIPSGIFEDTIQSFFSISQEELRTLCRYDPETDSYPYRPVHGNDLTAWGYPMCEPEVMELTENPDGTVTLFVRIYSPELKTNNLFQHKLTVRPLSDGGFQYVANEIVSVSSRGLPPSMSRFDLD